MLNLYGRTVTGMAAKQIDNPLQKHRVAIVKGLTDTDGDQIADALLSDRTLTEEMHAKVVQEKEPEKKSRLLLDTLGRRGQKAPCSLYYAFKNIIQNDTLADLFIPYVRAIEAIENLMEPKKWPPSKEEYAQMVDQNLHTIKTIRSPWLHEYNNNTDVYRMHKKTRGVVFIINNEKFKNPNMTRTGTVQDGRNMTDVFEQLQFKVISKMNLPSKEMVDFLKTERDKVDWKEMECVIIILMSHGEGCYILGSDEEYVPLKTLTDLFSNEQCIDLHEKPRLVFVQACRIAVAQETSPKIVMVEPLSSNTVLFKWDAPDKHNGIIQGYKIFYTTNAKLPIPKWETHEVAVQSSREEATISKLMPNTTYSLCVLAYSSKGEGPLSDVVKVKTKKEENKAEKSEASLDKTDSVPYKETYSRPAKESHPGSVKEATAQDKEIKQPAKDYLVAYATPEGTSAFRHQDTGSWFLTAVMWTFKNYAHKEHLLDLLTRVNKLVARGASEVDKSKSTVSEVKSNLTKKCFFFPGVYDYPPRLVEK